MSSSKSEREKHSVLPSTAPQAQRPHAHAAFSRFRCTSWVVLLLFSFACVYTTFTHGRTNVSALLPLFPYSVVPADSAPLCPQAAPLLPTANAELWEGLSETFKSDAFLDRAIDWLAGAVRIP